MKLTVAQCQNAKPKDKEYKLPDGKGLYLVVRPTGAKFWIYRFELNGKESMFSIGGFPKVTLAMARIKRDEAKLLIREKKNPVLARKAQRVANQVAQSNTFKAIAEDWCKRKMEKKPWAVSTYAQYQKVMASDIFPAIGDLPINEIDATHISGVIEQMGDRGAECLAIVALQWTNQVFRHAARKGIVQSNPADVVRGIVSKPAVKHRTPLKRDDIHRLTKALSSYGGHFPTLCAIKLLMMTFVRTSELVQARWNEIDLDAAQWVIPAKRMKARRDHLVPLSRQAISLLTELKKLTGHSPENYLFQNIRRPDSHMATTTINRVLEYIGFAEKGSDKRISGHSFRTTASTELHGLKYPSVIIELQLAHLDKNKTRASYNMAEHLDERISLMQDWADLLDAWGKAGSKAAPLRNSAQKMRLPWHER